jgi:hypothetical protein
MIGKEQLFGAWHLVKHGRFDAEGHYYVTDDGRNGQLTYAPDGSMSVLITKIPEPTELTDIIAYAGVFTVEGDKVFHHIKIASNSNRIGTTETRFATLRGNELTLKTELNDEGHYEIVWQKQRTERETT